MKTLSVSKTLIERFICCSPRNRTQDGLSSPSLCVMNISCAPQRERRNNPRPEELPEDRRRPIQPTLACKHDHPRFSQTHHSHPRPISTFCSISVPWTSVPGMPQELCHLREMRYMKIAMNSCRNVVSSWCPKLKTPPANKNGRIGWPHLEEHSSAD